jgi:succinoglycan biosynthesis protein ExoA
VSEPSARAWTLGEDPDDWPTVSVVMPIRNEEPHLERAVAAVLAQDYPRPFEVCLAVAPSSDATERLATRLAADDDRVLVVPNPSGVTPAGLNAAIRATSGEVVVRVDGHSQLSPATSAGRSRRWLARGR